MTTAHEPAPVARIVIDNAHIATVDPGDTEFTSGHVVVAGNRIEAVGAGPAPEVPGAVRRIDASGHLLTPGLVNTHHHFYQWLTRGFAQQAILFDWLVELYPTWARIDDELCHAAAQGSAAALLTSGCTTAADHAYVFPRGAGDILGAEIAAVAELGLRFHPTRGSMDRSRKDGGLPPDNAVETTDEALAATEAAIDRWHDPSFGSMLRIAAAPCSPFSVSTELMRESAVLARRKGVRLHTHGSETLEEERYCRELFKMGPTDYFESVGWLGDDVWIAHSVHMGDSDIAKFAATGTGVATCPSSNARLAAGVARVPDLLRAGVRVGLGVDGSASNEAGELATELRNLLLLNRVAWGADALTARQALRVATLGGAQVLGRDREIGSIEPGKLADLALWRMDGLRHAGIADKVAALVLGAAAPLTLLLVNGVPVVENDRLTRADEDTIARDVATAAATLARRAGLT
ncbi:8-oxoguanine deaminase [Yinghuangia sp. ASG 101]|uniref:8-oxoguanine deaminase n=1 Tax=Yinghuangia sp. ASG 101 TaxID=2896848 RepID=UPI001E5F7E75|nr:8-oxoguanine deaminase [Yinghuangia sp. ASG 101]UGQ09619.1 8-oxoguanine deaminase [Yinghuangia sp. ASG 101]